MKNRNFLMEIAVKNNIARKTYYLLDPVKIII